MKLAHFLGMTMVLGAVLHARATEPRLALEQVGVWNAPPVDLKRLAEEARGPRVGVRLSADLSPANSGTWEDASDGSREWRLRLRSAGARWLVLGFDAFRLPAGARLVAYDPEGLSRLGPYTRRDVRPDGALWLSPVDGDEVVLELHWPRRLAGTEPDLHLGTVSHGYRSLTIGDDPDSDAPMLPGGIGDPGSSGSCNVDLACPAGQAWQDQKRGVVLMLLNGSVLCSGSLINNTALDCRPLVLSASHCYNIEPGLTPAGTTFLFNFERSSCGGGGSAQNQFITGSTQVSRAPAPGSDFILLELDQDPPVAFNVYFNGWSRSAQPATAGTTIHHPSGDFKKISSSDDPLIPAIFILAGQQTPTWRVDNWESGAAEDGSSGAPLFDPNQRIVGQLTGGDAACGNAQSDDFGRFDISWTGGGTAATRLRDALDPDAGGASTLNGMDQSFCGALDPLLEFKGVTLDDSDGNQDGFLDPGDVGSLEVEIQNEGPLAATSITGTLSTTDPSVLIYVDQAEWSDIPPGESGTSSSRFVVDVDSGVTCGSVISFQLAVESAEGSWEAPFEVSTGTLGDVTAAFQDDMQGGNTGWATAQISGTNPWLLATNMGDTDWFVHDIISPSESTLRIPAVAVLDPLPPTATLRFVHRMDSEFPFDGGLIEFSTDPAHVVWQDAGSLITAGGYNGTIDNSAISPIAGRAAWTGDVDEQTVELQLASLAGQPLSLRWRFVTDAAIGAPGEGWHVDDVVLEVAASECAPPAFRWYPGARCRGFRPGQTVWYDVCAQPRPGDPRAPRTGRDSR